MFTTLKSLTNRANKNGFPTKDGWGVCPTRPRLWMMYRNVTNMTEWYYNQVVFEFIAIVVVVLCCIVTFLALKRRNYRKNAVPNSMDDSSVCLRLFAGIVSVSPVGILASFGVTIKFSVIVRTLLTEILSARFARHIFRKLGDGFNPVAFVAFVCYDGIRHNQFLCNWLSFRAICGHDPAGGLSHSIAIPIYVKYL